MMPFYCIKNIIVLYEIHTFSRIIKNNGTEKDKEYVIKKTLIFRHNFIHLIIILT